MRVLLLLSAVVGLLLVAGQAAGFIQPGPQRVEIRPKHVDLSLIEEAKKRIDGK